MSDIGSMLERLKKRAAKLERQESLSRLIEALENRSMNHDEKTRLLGKIMALCAAGKITPSESNRMTKAIKIRG